MSVRGPRCASFVTLGDMGVTHTLRDLRRAAEELWPTATAEDWDQVGLTVGRDDQTIYRVLLAVDPVRATVDEALAWRASVLLTHHPLLLRGINTVAEDTSKGTLVADLIRAECSLLTAHTNADAPEYGVSDIIARKLGLVNPIPIDEGATPDLGTGRVGTLEAPESLGEFVRRVVDILPQTAGGVRVAGSPDQQVQRVALCGGAGDGLLSHPRVRGADVYVTSDLRHHPTQDAREQSLVTGGPALVDVSHWASESLWLETAAEQLRAALPGVDVRVSTVNTDPWIFQV